MEKGIKQVYTALGIELIRCFVSDKKTGRFLNRERLGRLPKNKIAGVCVHFPANCARR